MRRHLALACTVSTLLAAGLSGRQVRDAAIAPPPAGTAILSGLVVMDEANGLPVRKARVTLNSVTSVLVGRTVTTDDAGRFAFANVPAGRFNLAAAKPGYLNANYGAKLQDRPGTPIGVGAGQQVSGLIIRMARGGVITGVVRDQNGQPAFGAGVSVLRYGYSAFTGERSLGSYSTGGSGGADDRGVYRVYGLPPGEYVVMATANGGFRAGDEIERLTAADIQRGRLMIGAARSGMPGPAAGGSAGPPPPPNPHVTFAPVFFPGVTDFSLATSITLGVAEERSGVDVQVQLVPTARVEGTVKLPEGIAPSSVVVTIASNGPMAGWLGGLPQSKRLDPGGRFVMTGVAPGSYAIKARSSGSAAPGAPPGISPSSYWAQSDVVVDGHDLQVAMELQPGMVINGRLAFEGTTPPPTDLAGVRFILMPRGSGANLSAGPSGGITDAAGRFSFPGVAPDRFRVTYSSNVSWMRTWTLKSAIAAGKDAMDEGLEVKPGTDVDMVVTFTDHPSELTGALQDTSGRAAPDYFIIVFAADRALWTPGSRRVRMIRPGNDGQFSVTGLPPGEYRVAALTDVANGEWYNPAFLEGLLPASVKVAIVEGQRTTQNLKIGG